jgi:hypothetical protein
LFYVFRDKILQLRYHKKKKLAENHSHNIFLYPLELNHILRILVCLVLILNGILELMLTYLYVFKEQLILLKKKTIDFNLVNNLVFNLYR